MIRFLIHRPIAVLMVYFALVSLGVLASLKLPISLLPDIQIPEITVHVSSSNFTAREFEDFVIRKLRMQLMECSGISEVNSETHDGHSILHLRFKYGMDTDFAAIDVNEKIDRAMTWLPKEVDRPKVIKASAADIPILYLNINLKNDKGRYDFLQVSGFIQNVIRKRLEQLEEVALVDITGADKAAITIIPDINKMDGLGLSYDLLAASFKTNNLQIGSLSVKDGNLQYNIRFSSQLKNVEDIENIYIAAGARLIQLKEIAAIVIKPEKKNGFFLVNGKPGVSLAIIKQSQAKLDDLKKRLTEITTLLKNDYPELEFRIAQDQSTFLDYSIKNLKSTLAGGGILAFIIVLIFMSNLRLSALIGITMPICVAISLLFFLFFGISINIISLSGLILGTGLMIDNSIIVIDNISQYRQRGYNIEEACIKGVNELITPLLSSSLTTSAVFIPLVFLSGIAGALFFDQAITVSIGLGVSFLVSITFLPVIYYVFFSRSIESEFYMNKQSKLEIIYNWGLNFVFRYKWRFLIISLLFTVSSYFLFDKINKEAFPSYSQKEIMLNIDWNENITISENQNRVKYLLSEINNHLVQSNIWIGQQDYLLNSDFNTSSTEVNIYIEAETPEKLDTLKHIINKKLPIGYSAASYSFKATDNIFEKTFSNKESSFIVKLHQTEQVPNYENIKKTYSLLTKNISSAPKNKLDFENYISIAIDFEKLMIYHVSIQEVYDKLKTIFGENRIGTIKSYNEMTSVFIGSSQQDFLKQLKEAKVMSSNGTLMSIMNLVALNNIKELKKITADQDNEYVPLEFDVSSEKKKQIETQVRNLIENSKIKIDYSFGGNLDKFSQYMRELLIVLLISVALLYLILAAQFESLLQPLILLIEIPIDIAAALFILYISGESFNIMSAIGIIVMTGIIINDSIIKIDIINQLRRNEKMNVLDAIHEGGKRRLKSIIMASLTTILSVVPVLFGSDLGSELQKPLALTLLGGLTVGTLVSLYLIPLIYWFIYRKKDISN